MTPNQRHSPGPKGLGTHSPIPRPVELQHLRTFIFLSRILVKKVGFTRWQSGESQGEVCTLWAWQRVSQGQTGPHEPGGPAGRLEREDGPPQSLMWEDRRWAFRGLESSLREGPWGREVTSLCRTCPDTWDRSTGEDRMQERTGATNRIRRAGTMRMGPGQMPGARSPRLAGRLVAKVSKLSSQPQWMEGHPTVHLLEKGAEIRCFLRLRKRNQTLILARFKTRQKHPMGLEARMLGGP